jgi:hypothetical protein
MTASQNCRISLPDLVFIKNEHKTSTPQPNRKEYSVEDRNTMKPFSASSFDTDVFEKSSTAFNIWDEDGDGAFDESLVINSSSFVDHSAFDHSSFGHDLKDDWTMATEETTNSTGRSSLRSSLDDKCSTQGSDAKEGAPARLRSSTPRSKDGTKKRGGSSSNNTNSLKDLFSNDMENSIADLVAVIGDEGEKSIMSLLTTDEGKNVNTIQESEPSPRRERKEKQENADISLDDTKEETSSRTTSMPQQSPPPRSRRRPPETGAIKEEEEEEEVVSTSMITRPPRPEGARKGPRNRSTSMTGAVRPSKPPEVVKRTGPPNRSMSMTGAVRPSKPASMRQDEDDTEQRPMKPQSMRAFHGRSASMSMVQARQGSSRRLTRDCAEQTTDGKEQWPESQEGSTSVARTTSTEARRTSGRSSSSRQLMANRESHEEDAETSEHQRPRKPQSMRRMAATAKEDEDDDTEQRPMEPQSMRASYGRSASMSMVQGRQGSSRRVRDCADQTTDGKEQWPESQEGWSTSVASTTSTEARRTSGRSSSGRQLTVNHESHEEDAETSSAQRPRKPQSMRRMAATAKEDEDDDTEQRPMEPQSMRAAYGRSASMSMVQGRQGSSRRVRDCADQTTDGKEQCPESQEGSTSVARTTSTEARRTSGRSSSGRQLMVNRESHEEDAETSEHQRPRKPQSMRRMAATAKEDEDDDTEQRPMKPQSVRAAYGRSASMSMVQARQGSSRRLTRDCADQTTDCKEQWPESQEGWSTSVASTTSTEVRRTSGRSSSGRQLMVNHESHEEDAETSSAQRPRKLQSMRRMAATAKEDEDDDTEQRPMKPQSMRAAYGRSASMSMVQGRQGSSRRVRDCADQTTDGIEQWPESQEGSTSVARTTSTEVRRTSGRSSSGRQLMVNRESHEEDAETSEHQRPRKPQSMRRMAATAKEDEQDDTEQRLMKPRSMRAAQGRSASMSMVQARQGSSRRVRDCADQTTDGKEQWPESQEGSTTVASTTSTEARRTFGRPSSIRQLMVNYRESHEEDAETSEHQRPRKPQSIRRMAATAKEDEEDTEQPPMKPQSMRAFHGRSASMSMLPGRPRKPQSMRRMAKTERVYAARKTGIQQTS